MIRTETTSQWRDRIIGLFKKEPHIAFPVMQVENRLQGIKRPILDYHLKNLVAAGILEKPKHGFYQLSPNQLKVLTPEEAREKVQQHLSTTPARVQEGAPFDPLKPAIVLGPGPALEARRRHFSSILKRMMKNDSFTEEDVEFLESAVSPEMRLRGGPPAP